MDTFIQFLRNLGTGRLIMIAGVGAVTMLLFSVVIGQIGTSPMTTLYAGLGQADANEIIQQLETQNVPYEIQAGGSAIAVPRDQVDRLRLSLASTGLTGGVIGNEIFDRDASFGRTSMELNFNRLRAIEGELTRTITSLSSVNSARVHIVLPERTPFSREANDPSASIVIKAGGGLNSSLAQTIQAVVAGAVPGLSADRVAITDTNGRLLADGQPDNQSGGFSSLDEALVMRERRYTRQIEALLNSSLGAGNFDVSVALEMDMERQTTSAKIYDPDTQVVLSQEVSEKDSREANKDNLPVTAGNNDPNSSAIGAALSSQDTETNERTNFENSFTETVSVKEPGAITRMSIAVVVNVPQIDDPDNPGQKIAGTPRTADELSAIEELVKSAVPFVENDNESGRADIISVQELLFTAPPEVTYQGGSENILGFRPDDVVALLRNGGVIVVAVLFLLIVVRPIVMRIIEAIPDAPPPPDPNAIEAAPQQELPQISGPQDVSQDLIARAASGDEAATAALISARQQGLLDMNNLNTDGRIDVAQVEGRIQESALKKVADIIRANPEESVAIVRSWLYAE